MDFDNERLEALAMGAAEAADGGNLIVSVRDLRWLTEQLTALFPAKPQFDEYNRMITEINDGSGDA